MPGPIDRVDECPQRDVAAFLICRPVKDVPRQRFTAAVDNHRRLVIVGE
jgi:hypothetical protein